MLSKYAQNANRFSGIVVKIAEFAQLACILQPNVIDCQRIKYRCLYIADI